MKSTSAIVVGLAQMVLLLVGPAHAEELKTCLTVKAPTPSGEQRLEKGQKEVEFSRLYVATSSNEKVILIAQGARKNQKFAQICEKADMKGTFFDMAGLEGAPCKFYLVVLPEQSTAASEIAKLVRSNQTWTVPQRRALNLKVTQLQNTRGVSHFGVQVQGTSVAKPGPSSSNPKTIENESGGGSEKAKKVEDSPAARAAPATPMPQFDWQKHADVRNYERGTPVFLIYEVNGAEKK